MPVSPKQAADNVLGRARALAVSSIPPGLPLSVDELNRMALAMGMAAIDTYMHWRVRRSVDVSASPSKALADLDVPFGALLASGQKSVEARNNGIKDKPGIRALNTLHEVLLKETFQTPRGIEKAFALIGVRRYWSTIAASMPGAPTVDAVKARLNALAAARNYIVHEGDIQRQSKPRTVKLNPHDHAQVLADLDWIEDLLKALDSV